MKVAFSTFLAVALAITGLTSANAHAGNCDYSWQTAKDGSRCGNRAADRQ